MKRMARPLRSVSPSGRARKRLIHPNPNPSQNKQSPPAPEKNGGSPFEAMDASCSIKVTSSRHNNRSSLISWRRSGMSWPLRTNCQTQSYLRIGQRYLRMTHNPLRLHVVCCRIDGLHPRPPVYCNSDGRFAQIASWQYCSMAWPTLLIVDYGSLESRCTAPRSKNLHLPAIAGDAPSPRLL